MFIVNNKYVIGVKDHKQRYITNSCGYRLPTDNNYEGSDFRELNEETSIVTEEVTSIKPCGHLNYVNNCYDHNWIRKTPSYLLSMLPC